MCSRGLTIHFKRDLQSQALHFWHSESIETGTAANIGRAQVCDSHWNGHHTLKTRFTNTLISLTCDHWCYMLSLLIVTQKPLKYDLLFTVSLHSVIFLGRWWPSWYCIRTRFKILDNIVESHMLGDSSTVLLLNLLHVLSQIATNARSIRSRIRSIATVNVSRRNEIWVLSPTIVIYLLLCTS